MIKTQIQLEPWQYEALKRTSSSSSRSMSDLIREGVSLLLKKSAPQVPHSLEQVAGKYTSLPHSELKDHDRFWADSIR
jgi:Arc/MetJ-type ribon-helix-helix transcriptional regulator